MKKAISRRDDNVVVVENGDIHYTCWIPTRGRPMRVMNNPMFPIANLLIAEHEVEAYERVFAEYGRHPGNIIPHNVDGNLSAIMNIPIDHHRPETEGFVTLSDDDVVSFIRLYTFRSKRTHIKKLPKILDILAHTYLCARDIGAGIFCYARSPTHWERHAYNPFRLRGWGMSSMIGLIRSDVLRFDENMTFGMNIDISLQSVAHTKFAWQSLRFYAHSNDTAGGGSDVAGLAPERTPNREREEIGYLQRKWSAPVVSTKHNKEVGKLVNIVVDFPKEFNDPVNRHLTGRLLK